MTKTPRIKFLREYEELFNPYWRNIVYYGGRYSGKSYHVALALLIDGRREKLRILCTREIQNTIRDSVYKLLKDLIERYEMNEYIVKHDTIINPGMGTEFFFKGVRRNINEIKSTEGVDKCWVEEAQSITEESLDILTPTIRKPGSQMIFTFNRFSELDPVYVRYVMNRPDKTFVRKVNYDTLERVGLLSDSINLEIENDRKDIDLFAHKWLGEPLGQGDLAVIPRHEILNAMNREVEPEGQVEVGVDVARMGQDRTVFWMRKGHKTTKYKVYDHKKTVEVCDLLEEFVGHDKDILIKIDDTGVGGGVTDEMERRGYTVMPINFGAAAQERDDYPNLISEAWFQMKNIIQDVQLPMDQDLLQELSTRQWKQDSKGRRVIESKDRYKDRGYKSPDLADACIICYYEKNLIGVDDVDIL